MPSVKFVDFWPSLARDRPTDLRRCAGIFDHIVPQLTAERRATCRQAVGPELIADARILSQLSLVELPQPGLPPPIPLHPALTRNDLERGWIADLVAPLRDALDAIGEFAFADDAMVGRRLRGVASALMREALAAAALGSFLSEFGPDPVARAHSLLTVALWHQAALSVRLLTAETDDELGQFAQLHRTAVDLEAESEAQLAALLIAQVQPIRHEDVVAATLGEVPGRPLRSSYDFMHAYGRDPTHLFDLGMRQLRRLVSYPEIPLEFATGFISSALKIGTSSFPIYSHLVADAVGNLVAQAAERDREATGRLLADFNGQQAGRIQAAGNSFETLLAQAQAGGDDFAYPDAYRTVAEGILRPFGSLLVHLAELATGEAAGPVVLVRTLGELETAMGVFDQLRSPASDIPRLLSLGLDRPMRNYEAHEDIVRSGTGALSIIGRDGVLEPLDLDDLQEHLMTLLSFLVGVDVAQNMAVIPALGGGVAPANTVHTEALIGGIAALAVAELTDAVLTDCSIREGIITVEIDGDATTAQLELLRGPLRRLLDPAVEMVEVVRAGSGRLVYTAVLESDESPAEKGDEAEVAIEVAEVGDQDDRGREHPDAASPDGSSRGLLRRFFRRGRG
jgi:hypothetical protein